MTVIENLYTTWTHEKKNIHEYESTPALASLQFRHENRTEIKVHVEANFITGENSNKSRKQFDGIGEDTPAQLQAVFFYYNVAHPKCRFYQYMEIHG